MPTVLAIDDDRSIRHLINHALTERDYIVELAEDGVSGLDMISRVRPDVVLLDILLPEMNGLELFRKIQALDKRLPVIFITAEAGSSTAIEAMQMGAFDYIAKPLQVNVLREVVAAAARTRKLMNDPVALPLIDSARSTGDRFIGKSSKMLDVFKTIGRVAKQNVSVLIRGESGCGKELVARAIYQYGTRKGEPFMAVNCAALPDQLLESELFGYEKGAFTGADRKRIGKFEQCNGGMIFLDEVGDMSSLVQGKVLRLLQDQSFERLGGNETIHTNVRVVAATNRNLEEMVANGEFREDLFYRLNGITINLPPLRERKDDIPALLEYFLAVYVREMDKKDIEGLSAETLQRLKDYSWPGNVRQLQSVVRQMLLNTVGTVIGPDSLPAENFYTVPQSQVEDNHTNQTVSQLESSHEPDLAESVVLHSPVETAEFDMAELIQGRLAEGSDNLYAEAVEHLERYLFTKVLQVTQGNQSRAAEILGVTRGKVRDRIASFNIQMDRTISVE